MMLVHSTAPVQPRERLLRLPQVEALTGLKKSSIYAMTRAGTFPRQVRLSQRCAAWPESAVLAWVNAKVAEAQQ
ncbi:helix-turn-helix transcriptional regulator [Extensimonas perlucida]|uniref:helix-turn-helix transcriptional regulator n=1 Tax=Extensimonas perlucida TaxID=2590786 RepID=UPI001C92D493|nr:AlpA family phage regulatory protein [Extensimonas perlucida]